MAIINAIDCFYTGDTQNINFNNNSVNIGEFWYCTNNTDPIKAEKVVCAEITDNTDEPGSTLSALTEYATCYDCWANNYGVFFFNSCSGNLEIPLVIDVSAVTPTFFSTFDSILTYYIECEINGLPVIGCFNSRGEVKFKNPSLLTESQYNQISADLQSVGAEIVNNIIGITAFTSCDECSTNSPIIYDVLRCADSSIDYVQLPNNSFVDGDLISYTDGTDEICGVINGISTISVPSFTFVAYYGNKVECEVCLEQENNKYLISNCVDSNIQEVVWGSQLFQNGLISNLQKNGGCYEVVGQTTDPVTSNLFLDFEPQPTCNSCLECNGVYYEYAYCNDPLFKVGEILSYQIIPVGGVFFHPNEGQYVVRMNAIPEPTMNFSTFYSLFTLPDCNSFTPTVSTWEVAECTNGFRLYVTINGGTGNPGDIVQVLWGENELFCVELITDVTGVLLSRGPFFNSTGTIYTQCEECTSATTIGLRTINCYTQEIGVSNLSYSDWTQITNYGGFGKDLTPSNCFLDSNGFCRNFAESCPTAPIGNLVSISEQYLNCAICTTFHPRPPLPPTTVSAGTEYFACNICCPCTTGETITQVSVPHPTWVNGQGNAVVLLDAVTLGGPNGLNM
jgi:hypothetical protein